MPDCTHVGAEFGSRLGVLLMMFLVLDMVYLYSIGQVASTLSSHIAMISATTFVGTMMGMMFLGRGLTDSRFSMIMRTGLMVIGSIISFTALCLGLILGMLLMQVI